MTVTHENSEQRDTETTPKSGGWAWWRWVMALGVTGLMFLPGVLVPTLKAFTPIGMITVMVVTGTATVTLLAAGTPNCG